MTQPFKILNSKSTHNAHTERTVAFVYFYYVYFVNVIRIPLAVFCGQELNRH